MTMYKQLLANDFKDQDADLVQQLSYTLNPFLESVSNKMNGKLNFVDNFQCKLLELNDITSESKNIISEVTGFTINGTMLISVFNVTDNNGSVNAAPYVQWVKSEKGIKIEKFHGLVDGKKYTIKLLVI